MYLTAKSGHFAVYFCSAELIFWVEIQNKKFNSRQPKFFLYLSWLPAFLLLVFQPLMSAQTGFMIGAWQPSGLDYWSLIQHTKDLIKMRAEPSLVRVWISSPRVIAEAETWLGYVCSDGRPTWSLWVFLFSNGAPVSNLSRLCVFMTKCKSEVPERISCLFLSSTLLFEVAVEHRTIDVSLSPAPPTVVSVPSRFLTGVGVSHAAPCLSCRSAAMTWFRMLDRTPKGWTRLFFF